MKAMLLDAEWRPRPGYRLNERERATQRGYNGSQVFYNPNLKMIEIPVPQPGPGEVLVKVKATGVCGSDVHFSQRDRDGYTLYPGHCKFPVVLGHEWSGQVAALGPGVTSLQVGDAVSVEEMSWCGECTPCRAGFVNQCQNLEEIGVTYQGAFAEYVVCGAKYCWKIDGLLEIYGESLGYQAGAMVEPCSVAYNALFISAGGVQPGAHVLVAGSGPIGLLSIALLRTSGAARIIVMEPSAPRREAAMRMGADFAFDPVAAEKEGVAPADIIMQQTRGAGVKMAVEAAAAGSRTYPVFEEVLSPGGKMVQTGMGGERVPLSMVRLQYGMLHLSGSVGHSGFDIFPSVIRLMEAKRINPLSLVTATYALDQSIEAVHCAETLQDLKVMVLQ
jgi:scyllo-inosose 3-dehydrogenase